MVLFLIINGLLAFVAVFVLLFLLPMWCIGAAVADEVNKKVLKRDSFIERWERERLEKEEEERLSKPDPFSVNLKRNY